MTSIVINHFGDPDVLELTDLPVPEPGPGQVRVRVGATAVHPVDLFVRSGPPPFLLGEAEPPYVLGWDLAGTVDATGAGADRFQPGDAVVGLSRWFDSHTGTNADLVVFDESWLAPAPTSVSVAEAATLPLNAVTADRALDLLGLRTGQTLVVTGAAGAVGGFAVEMAARRGLEVVAVAAAGDEATVRDFGATELVPRTDDVARAVRVAHPDGVDAVLDAAPVGPAAIGAVRDGGRYVAVTAGAVPAPERGIDVQVVEAGPDGRRLAELAADVDAGLLTLRLAATFPLAEAAAAHRRRAEGGLRGGVVLLP